MRQVFEVRQGAIALSDLTVAAALLCDSCYWGNDRKSREEGPLQKQVFAPATLNTVERYRQGNKIAVVFVIGGADVKELRHRRWLFHEGCIKVHSASYQAQRARLMQCIREALNDAAKGDVERAENPPKVITVHHRHLAEDEKHQRTGGANA